MIFKRAAFFGLALVVAACGQREEVLVGERLTVTGAAISAGGEMRLPELPKLRLAKATVNNSWTHQSGNAQNNAGHYALSPSASMIWSTKVGKSQSRRYQMSAAPVSEGGIVYALDSRSTLSAVSGNGGIVWTKDLTAIFDKNGDAAGGGLTVSGGQVFATTGFGEIIALNAATGDLNWRHDLGSFGGAAPTVYDGLVYVAARDGTAWAIHTDTGRVKWQIPGPESSAHLTGGPGPAVNAKWSVFPFATGELMSTFRKGGLTNWTTIVSGSRTGSAAAAIDDITGGPLIAGDRIYVSNSSGRTVGLTLRDGNRVWTARHGAQDLLTLGGTSLFLVDDENFLVRLSAKDGQTLWKVELPRYPTGRFTRSRGIVAHFGPVLAGGHLWVASADENLRVFSPQTGKLLRTVELSAAATSTPIVVNNTLYVLTADAKLHAFR